MNQRLSIYMWNGRAADALHRGVNPAANNRDVIPSPLHIFLQAPQELYLSG